MKYSVNNKMKLKIIFFVLLYTLFTNCTDPQKKEMDEITKLVYGEESKIPYNTKLLFAEEIQLDESPEIEKVFLLQAPPNETLVITRSLNDKKLLLKQISFTMPHFGHFQYSEAEKRWKPTQGDDWTKTMLVKSIEFYKLPGDNFSSIFLKILSEEPPLPLFLVPIIIRKTEIIWNGIEELKEKNFFKQEPKVDFHFDEKEEKLNIISPSGKIELSYRYREGKFQLNAIQ